MDISRKIGVAVKAARHSAGLSQDELAEKVGKSMKTISNIERGAVAPSIETLYQIASALKVPMADLFQDVDKRRSNKRFLAETEARELLRSLNDQGLDLAIEQIEAIARRQ